MQKYQKAFDRLKESYLRNEEEILRCKIKSSKSYEECYRISDYILPLYPYRKNEEKIKKIVSLCSKIECRKYSYNFELFKKTEESLINLLAKDYNKVRDEYIKLSDFYRCEALYYLKKSELLSKENQKLIKKAENLKNKYGVA